MRALTLALMVGAATVVAAPAPALAEGAGVHVGRADGGGIADRKPKLPDRRRAIHKRLIVGRGDDDAGGTTVIVRPPEDAEASEVEPATSPETPPDPAAPFAGLRARGHDAARPRIEPGASLPEGTVFVTLNWRTYGLERPPAGAVYARIGRGIYLIDPDGRRVLERVAPEGVREGG